MRPLFTTFCVGFLLYLSCGAEERSLDIGNMTDELAPDFLPLFDTHAHQMPTDYPDGWLESLLLEHQPEGIVLLGIGNVYVHQENHPGVAFAFANFKDLEIDLSKVDSQLGSGFRGIGEVSIRHFGTGPPGNKSADFWNPFDEPPLLDLYDVAQKHTVPVLFHFDYDSEAVETIERILPDYPETIFIWAHAGDAQPDELRPLMKAHENLHLDLSCRNPLDSFKDRLTTIDLQRMDEPNGTLKTEWKELLTDFADRIYYGSDIGPKGRLEEYGAIQKYYRDMLGQLEPEVAEKIAFKNAVKLFGLNAP